MRQTGQRLARKAAWAVVCLVGMMGMVPSTVWTDEPDRRHVWST
jgi:hypothetical protein